MPSLVALHHSSCMVIKSLSISISNIERTAAFCLSVAFGNASEAPRRRFVPQVRLFSSFSSSSSQPQSIASSDILHITHHTKVTPSTASILTNSGRNTGQWSIPGCQAVKPSSLKALKPHITESVADPCLCVSLATWILRLLPLRSVSRLPGLVLSFSISRYYFLISSVHLRITASYRGCTGTAADSLIHLLPAEHSQLHSIPPHLPSLAFPLAFFPSGDLRTASRRVPERCRCSQGSHAAFSHSLTLGDLSLTSFRESDDRIKTNSSDLTPLFPSAKEGEHWSHYRPSALLPNSNYITLQTRPLHRQLPGRA